MAIAMAKAVIPAAKTRDQLNQSFAPKGIKPYKYDRNQIVITDRFKNTSTLSQSFRYEAVNPNKTEKSPVRYRRREEVGSQAQFKNTTELTASRLGSKTLATHLTKSRFDE